MRGRRPRPLRLHTFNSFNRMTVKATRESVRRFASMSRRRWRRRLICRRRRRSRALRRCTRSQLALLVRRQQEHVAHEKLRMIAVIIIESFGRRAIEDHALALFPEQPRWHRRSRTYLLRVEQPAISPLRLQALAREQKIRRGLVNDIVIVRDVALQTWSARRCEQLAREESLLVCQRLKLLAYVRLLLRRDGHEEVDQ